MLFQKISEDIKTAMKEKKSFELGVLRMVLASLKNKKIELKLSEDLNDEQVLLVLSTEVKKRKDSISSYKEGGREDLVVIEEKELAVLNTYMPELMSEDEIEMTVREVITTLGEISMKQFGQVMGQVMGRLKGKADGEVVKQIVEKLLKK